MPRTLILFSACLVTALALLWMRQDFARTADAAMEMCNAMVLQRPDLDVTSKDINCQVVDADIFLRLSPHPDSKLFVECDALGTFLTRPPPWDCWIGHLR